MVSEHGPHVVGGALLHGGGHCLFAHEQVRRVQAVDGVHACADVHRPGAVLADVVDQAALEWAPRDDDGLPRWFQADAPPFPGFCVVSDRLAGGVEFVRGHVRRGCLVCPFTHVAAFTLIQDARGAVER